MHNRKKPDISTKNLMRELRPFVSFNYDLREKIAPQSKAKIRRYHQELQRLKSYPTIKYYRPRARAYKKAALKHSIADPSLRQFKVIPLGDIPQKARIRLTKELEIKAETITQRIFSFPFDPEKLIIEPLNYLQSLVDKNGLISEFRIKTGKSLTRGSYNRVDIIHTVIRYMQKYENWQEWLTGMVGYIHKNQVDIPENEKDKLR